jgi:carboxylate-amine ligase
MERLRLDAGFGKNLGPDPHGPEQHAQPAHASPTIGVEEEHFLVDPESRLPADAAPAVVARAAKTMGDSICG